jgi:hypothetical protein
MSAVARITVHHEGAGVPTDQPRGADGGYSYWLGSTTWTRLRPPELSYATLGFNHVSLDICLSGNRMVQPVTDADIAMIRAVCADARNRDELIDRPTVFAHKFSPGSSTVCPGDQTMLRWPEIVAACQTLAAGPRPVKVRPMISPPAQIVGGVVAAVGYGDGKKGYIVGRYGHVYNFGGAPYCGSPQEDKANGDNYWKTREAADITIQRYGLLRKVGYIVTATTGETYKYPRGS